MEDKIIQALNFTFENINGLHKEASILDRNSRIGRAYSLYHFCFEECGRFYLLHDNLMDLYKNKIKPKDLNYGNLKKLGYEKHQLKLRQSFEGMKKFMFIFSMISREQNNLTNTTADIEKSLIEIEKIIDKTDESEMELDRLKNVSLYVTFSNNKFHLPDRTITVAQYLNIQKLANLGAQVIKLMMEFYENKGGFKGFKDELRRIYNNET